MCVPERIPHEISDVRLKVYAKTPGEDSPPELLKRIPEENAPEELQKRFPPPPPSHPTSPSSPCSTF